MDGTAYATGLRLQVYAPGDRAVTSGGLTYDDICDLLDLATAFALSGDLSDEERAKRLDEIEFKRGDLHYRFDDCDHRSKSCRYSRGARK